MKDILQKKYDLLTTFIKENSQENRVKEASEVLGNPFYIFDVSLKLIVASHPDKINRKFLKKINKNYYVEPDLFNQILEDEDLKLLDNNETLVKKYKNIDEKLVIRRFTDGNYTLGYVCLELDDESQLEDDIELLEVGTEALAHELKIRGFSYNVDQVVFSRILDGSLTTKEEINDALSKIDFSLGNRKRLIVIKTNDIQKVGYTISNMNSEIKYFNYKNGLVYFTDKKIEVVDDFLKSVVKTINDGECNVGVSGIFYDMSELPIAYSQAIEAIEIGKKYHPEIKIHFFGDYRIVSMFKSQSRETLEKAVDRRLRKVIQYDTDNKTSYFNDLKVYFESGRSIKNSRKVICS